MNVLAFLSRCNNGANAVVRAAQLGVLLGAGAKLYSLLYHLYLQAIICSLM